MVHGFLITVLISSDTMAKLVGGIEWSAAAESSPSQLSYCNWANLGCSSSVIDPSLTIRHLEFLGSSSSIPHGSHVFLLEVVTLIFSENNQAWSQIYPCKIVNGLHGQNYFKIMTLRVNGIGDVGKNDIYHSSCTSLSVALVCPGHSVRQWTHLIGSDERFQLWQWLLKKTANMCFNKEKGRNGWLDCEFCFYLKM